MIDKWKTSDTIWMIVLIIGGLYFLSSTGGDTITGNVITSAPAVKESIIIEEPIIARDDFPNITEIHWGYMPITYKIDDNCDSRLTNLSRMAFKTIREETDWMVVFEEVWENPNISVHCKESERDEYNAGTTADAIYEVYEFNENIIISGDINIYGQGTACGTGYPAMMVHEILHLFDFIHNPGINSVMREYGEQSADDCRVTKMDREYVSCLKYIYSDGTFPGDCSNIDTVVLNNPQNNYACEDGWFPTTNTDGCCPEPDMFVNSDGDCDNGEDNYACEDGWFPDLSDEWCCPEPNMIIDSDGYCS